jgi:two-component system LytT family response regulator
MKIRCLVIDDKPLAVDLLVEYIKKIPYLELVGSVTDPVKGLELLRNTHVDLVFLDIQMPQLSGVEFLRLAGGKVKAIFTTAYVKYAIEGYDLDVLDYLLKPIAFDRFYQAAEKALRNFQTTAPELAAINEHPASNSYLFVKAEHRIHKIRLEDIIYIEGLENYVSIHTLSARILSLQTLKKMEEQLPPKNFIRVHRSFIISVQHICYIEKSNIILLNDVSVPIGNTYRENFFKSVDPNL